MDTKYIVASLLLQHRAFSLEEQFREEDVQK
jgi:hypothetical protein